MCVSLSISLKKIFNLTFLVMELSANGVVELEGRSKATCPHYVLIFAVNGYVIFCLVCLYQL